MAACSLHGQSKKGCENCCTTYYQSEVGLEVGSRQWGGVLERVGGTSSA